MVKVKDTSTFIEAAIAVHGDKYDYSQTVYVNSRSPVVIICRNCGPFTLLDVGSHYRKKTGCRVCNQEEMLHRKGSARRCDCCGKRVKYNANKRCQSCRDMLNDEWCVALSRSMSRLKSKAKRNGMDGWFRWAKNKQCIITNRTRLIPILKLRSVVGSWDAWEMRSALRQIERKAEDKWTKRLRNWGWALSQREKKQAEKNFGS